MAQGPKPAEVGLGQAMRLSNMPASKRLEFIAEGLPVILESALSLFSAARTLRGFPRETRILEGHSVEEATKILVLLDVARCPQKHLPSRIAGLIRSFYDHRARLIYAEAQTWKPVTVRDLQGYVDHYRKSHYLEGEYGEYIMPNWLLFQRESALYADVIGDENDGLSWSSPLEGISTVPLYDPIPLRTVEALRALGVLTKGGLKIVQDVWGKVDFVADEEWSTADELCVSMLNALEDEGLISDKATHDHVRAVRGYWQIPMYNIHFSQIPVSLEELREEQERQYPWEY